MELEEILNYIKAQGKVSTFDIQTQFGLSYAETKQVLKQLEELGKVRKVDEWCSLELRQEKQRQDYDELIRTIKSVFECDASKNKKAESREQLIKKRKKLQAQLSALPPVERKHSKVNKALNNVRQKLYILSLRQSRLIAGFNYGERMTISQKLSSLLIEFGIQVELIDIKIGTAHTQYLFNVFASSKCMDILCQYAENILSYLRETDPICEFKPMSDSSQILVGFENKKEIDSNDKRILRYWLDDMGGKASIVPLVRKFGINFTQAGRIFDELLELNCIEELVPGDKTMSLWRVIISRDDIDRLFSEDLGWLYELGNPFQVPEVTKEVKSIIELLSSLGIKVKLSETKIEKTYTRMVFNILSSNITIDEIADHADDVRARLRTDYAVCIVPIEETDQFAVQIATDERVRYEEQFHSEALQDSKGKLDFVIGKDLKGKEPVFDLASANMLITGANSYERVNAMSYIMESLVQKYSADYVKFLFVDNSACTLDMERGCTVSDSRRLGEIIQYNQTHALWQEDVMTDLSRSFHVLDYIIQEVETRRELFKENDVDDIDDYNQNAILKKEKTIPRLVLFVDEYFPFIVSRQNDFERLLQETRSADVGIQLVLSTKRIEPNIISGKVKANVKYRLTAKLGTTAQSEIVINCSGAESLSGHLDMLLYCSESGETTQLKEDDWFATKHGNHILY